MQKFRHFTFFVCIFFAITKAYGLEQDGYVSDSAMMLSSAEELLMERTLHDYEVQTSAEIAVVTVQTTHGQDIHRWATNLGNEWGVGKADRDNGVVIAIALADRRFAIAVGEGLEFFLSDSQSKKLLEKHLPGAFKERDYARGINNLLADVTDSIGHASEQERLGIMRAFKTRAAEESRARSQKRKNMVKGVGFVSFLIALLTAIFFAIKSFFKKKAERKRKASLRIKVASEIQKTEKRLNDRKVQVAEINGREGLPTWIRESYDARRGQLDQSIKNAESLIGKAKDGITNDPDQSNEDVSQALHELKRADQYIDQLDSTDQQIEEFQGDVRQASQEAQNLLEEVAMRYEKLMAEGFNLGGMKSSFEDCTRVVAANQQGVATRLTGDVEDESDEIGQTAQHIANELSDLLDSLNGLAADRDYVNREIQEMRETTESIADHDPDLQGKVRYLKENAVPSVWQSFSKKLESLKSQAEDLVARKLEIAESKVSMEVQDFAHARKAVEEARAHLNEIQSLRRQLSRVYEEFEKARGSCSQKLREAESAVQKARSAVRNSDVSEENKLSVSGTAADLAIISSLVAGGEDGGLFDWSTYADQLDEVISSSKDSIKAAKQEVKKAKDKRKKARARRSSAYSASNYSSEPSSPPPTNNFGGGNFGGGGASGGW